MVGRGWWLLVLTVCVPWMVCCVCGGSSCQQGQEFYNSQNGQCVPCTRCQHPLVVVVPCYVYQDAVCAPAVNFLPNLSQQHIEPQAPITLSTSPAPHHNVSKDSHQQERQKSSSVTNEKTNLSSVSDPVHGHQQVKDTFVFDKSHSKPSSNDSFLLQENNFEKTYPKQQQHHHHRHKHSGRHASGRTHSTEVLLVTALDPEMRGDNVSERDGANKSVFGLRDLADRDSRLFRVNISDGANSVKDQDNSLQEPEESSRWQNLFFLLTVVIISVFVVVLMCVILSQLRNVLVHRKLKRVCDGAPVEDSSNVAVMAQLLPAENRSQPSTFSTTRSYPISYTRCTSSRVPVTTASSIPSSPATARGQVNSESEHVSSQLYPPIPFTVNMDRLLEQRRVLGPASSVDTNLYIESWQQADSQVPSQLTPSSSSVLATRVESASACPSPVPLRTYRLGTASASASPLIAVRGNGSHAAFQALVSVPVDHPTSRSREVVLNST